MSTSSSARSRPVSLVKRSDSASSRGPLVAKLGASFQQDSAKRAILLQYMQISMLLCFVLLIALLANFSTTSYRLFATTSEGKLNMPPPVDEEIGDNVVNLWLTDAMTRIMTMGFHDYQLRMLEIRPFFTDRGWESFTRFQRTPYAINSAIRAGLENEYLMIKSQPAAPPQMVEKSLIGGVFTYKLQVRLNVTRYTTDGIASSRENFEVIVQRVTPEVNPSGIAISQFRYISLPRPQD